MTCLIEGLTFTDIDGTSKFFPFFCSWLFRPSLDFYLCIGCSSDMANQTLYIKFFYLNTFLIYDNDYFT